MCFRGHLTVCKLESEEMSIDLNNVFTATEVQDMPPQTHHFGMLIILSKNTDV